MRALQASEIKSLQEKFGDSFYLLDSDQFRTNFRELKEAFQKIYSNFNIAYSYKTNYTPKFCKLINEMGGYAEVVSEMELEIARRVGCVPNRIIWNGPIKNQKIAEEFICEGGTINVDNIEELDFIKQIVTRHSNRLLSVGIRCNFDVDDGVVSRFGFDIDSEEFKEAVRFTTTTKNVKLINFQCHFAKRQIDYWPARAQGMIEMIDKLGIIPDRIDIGGGLFGKMPDSLKAQFSSEIPNYESYAKAAATVFAEYFKHKEVQPELLIEPGSAMVGDCMKFVSSVKNIKKVRGKTMAAVLGSQKNISMSGVNPPMDVIAMGGEQKEYKNLDFVGFTCIEGDVLYHNYTGKLAHEDVIVIHNCGSYSLVMKPPFILPNFAVIDVCGEEPELIKRAECFDDLFHTYIF